MTRDRYMVWNELSIDRHSKISGGPNQDIGADRGTSWNYRQVYFSVQLFLYFYHLWCMKRTVRRLISREPVRITRINVWCMIQDSSRRHKEIWDLHCTSSIRNSWNCGRMFRAIYSRELFVQLKPPITTIIYCRVILTKGKTIYG